MSNDTRKRFDELQVSAKQLADALTADEKLALVTELVSRGEILVHVGQLETTFDVIDVYENTYDGTDISVLLVNPSEEQSQNLT
jgi:hypothetical protein